MKNYYYYYDRQHLDQINEIIYANTTPNLV